MIIASAKYARGRKPRIRGHRTRINQIGRPLKVKPTTKAKPSDSQKRMTHVMSAAAIPANGAIVKLANPEPKRVPVKLAVTTPAYPLRKAAIIRRNVNVRSAEKALVPR